MKLLQVQQRKHAKREDTGGCLSERELDSQVAEVAGDILRCLLRSRGWSVWQRGCSGLRLARYELMLGKKQANWRAVLSAAVSSARK